MESWSDFYNRKRKSKFADKSQPLFIGITDVKEVGWTIDFLTFSTQAYIIFTGGTIIKAILLGLSVHISLVLILSIISTILDRRYRFKQKIKRKLLATMDRFALNKLRKVKYGSKTGF